MVFKKESFGLDAPAPKLWDIHELSYESDECDDEPEPLHPEDWQDWHSENLLDAWMGIREYCDMRYIKIKTTYPKFVEFIMKPSGSSECRTQTEYDLWRGVSHYKLVGEDQFYFWVQENIDSHCNV